MYGKHPDMGQAILRIGLGILFFAAGLMKLFTAGVGGISGFLSSLGFPLATIFAVILIAVEIICGALLIIGWQTKWASFLLGIVIIVAILTVQIKNLAGDQAIQFFKDLSILVGLFAINAGGPGKWCLDKKH